MEQPSNSQSGQLPHITTEVNPQDQEEILEGGVSPEQTAISQAQGILMDLSRPPHDMARQFAQLKEGYISRTYGVTIE